MSSATTIVDDSHDERSPEFFLRLLREYRWPILILLAQLPMLLLHLRNLWLRPQYQYFPIVLLVVGYLFWTRTEAISNGLSGPKHRPAVNLLFAASLLILIFGSAVVFSPWLAAVAFVLTLGGVLLLVGERYFISNSLGIWILSLLLIPLPATYDLQLSRLLQRATTIVSGNLLERIGIFNIVEGTTLSLGSGTLFVDEACSGIVSMMSIVACALIVAVWFNRATVHLILLVISGLAWATSTNILRIMTLAMSQEYVGLDLTSGWKHSLLGMCLFALAFCLVLSTDRLLAWFFAPLMNDRFGTLVRGSLMTHFWHWLSRTGRPRSTAEKEEQIEICDDAYFGRKRRRLELMTAIWAVLFCLAGVTSARLALQDMSRPDLAPPKFAAGLQEDSLPAELNGWRRVGFSDQHAERLFAQQSKVWHYHNEDISAAFSVDFSFHYWHNLCDCYRSIGWDQQGDYQIKDSITRGAAYLASKFQKDGQYGQLLFCFVDENGHPYAPPDKVNSLVDSVRRRVNQADRTLFQIQMWVTSNRAPQSVDLISAQGLYELLRDEISSHILANATGDVQ